MSNPNTPQRKPLTDGQKNAMFFAVVGMLLVGIYGLVISYWTVRELAVKLHMPLPAVFPIGIEGGMIAVLAIDIVLTWIGRPIGWLRQVARALSATAIGINAYAGMEYGPAAVIMHALAPAILIVGVEALRHHLLVVLAVPEEREPIPRGRWALAPLSTVAMWRRMILWQQPKYSEALDTHLDRHEAIAELRRAFGLRWKRAIPAGLAYRLRVGVRLDESTAEVRNILADHYAHDVHTANEVPAHDVRELPVHAPAPPAWVPLDAHTRVLVGGDRADGQLDPGTRTLLPVECAHRARVRARTAEVGARAMETIRGWERPRVPETLAGPVRAHRVRIVPEQAVRPLRGVVRAEAPARTVVTERIDEHKQLPIPDAPEHATAPAARARRQQGAGTRARIVEHIAEHPDHDAEQIAAHVGVTASTVRRHLRTMRGK